MGPCLNEVGGSVATPPGPTGLRVARSLLDPVRNATNARKVRTITRSRRSWVPSASWRPSAPPAPDAPGRAPPSSRCGRGPRARRAGITSTTTATSEVPSARFNGIPSIPASVGRSRAHPRFAGDRQQSRQCRPRRASEPGAPPTTPKGAHRPRRISTACHAINAAVTRSRRRAFTTSLGAAPAARRPRPGTRSRRLPACPPRRHADSVRPDGGRRQDHRERRADRHDRRQA